MLSYSFKKVHILSILKYNKGKWIIKGLESIVNTDAKIISEQYSAMFNMYHDQVRFIPGMKSWFNIRNINYINELTMLTY